MLFTRAKRKIVTFTSLKPTDILVDEGKSRGVQMFRAWLEYCGSGTVPDRARPGGDTESPFEDYVAAQVEAMGCEAVPQVGTAGYRIDIGVRHPDWPYGYILGVECDGASYHSSKSSRDRDRLRQEVLEGLGWHFHRIWSTDWFNDPRTQIARLRDAIDAALERARSQGAPTAPKTDPVEHLTRTRIADEPETAKSASDDASSADTELYGDLFSPSLGSGPVVDEASEPALQTAITVNAESTIGLGSYVKVENLSEGGRKLAFTLVKGSNALESSEISIHTPLGQALLDAQEGDVVEYQVGVEIKEVRVLELSTDGGRSF